MEHHDTEGEAATAQGGAAPRAPYVRPILTELSVSATLGGTVATDTEADFVTFPSGTEFRGSQS